MSFDSQVFINFQAKHFPGGNVKVINMAIQMWPARIMKRLSVLRQESEDLQSKIRRLLLESYSYDNGLTKQLNVIAAVTKLRQKLLTLQREMRERQSVSA